MHDAVHHENETCETNHWCHLDAAGAEDVSIEGRFATTRTRHQDEAQNYHHHAYGQQYVIHAPECKILFVHIYLVTKYELGITIF